MLFRSILKGKLSILKFLKDLLAQIFFNLLDIFIFITIFLIEKMPAGGRGWMVKDNCS